MRVLCVFGEHNYGEPDRGRGYEYINFIPALRRLGHDVLFFESWNPDCYSDPRELNRKLLTTIEVQRPDVIFSVMFTYQIWLETLQILRDAGFAATVNWTTDDSWKYRQFSRFMAPAFHAFTTTYASAFSRYQRAGMHNVLLTQWAASAETLQPPLPAADCRYGVSFVGTAHGNRPEIVDSLRQRGIEVDCFGYGWPGGAVGADDIPHIIRSSVISLNFANSGASWCGRSAKRNNQLKARTFEVPGAGGFLLSEWCEGIEMCYLPGREIEVFHTVNELAEKVRYYLDNLEKRDEIAMAGFHRTCSEHTYDLRLAKVLEFALTRRDRFFAGHGILPSKQIDWSRFRTIEQEHTLNGGLSLLRHLLIPLCSAVWGPLRARRAARRLVFELSWRLAGRHTYSAGGWPGRMFGMSR